MSFRRFQRFYSSVKIATDMATLSVAFWLAYATRFLGLLGDKSEPHLEDTLIMWATSLVVFPFAFHQARLYATNRARTHLAEVFEVFKSTITATLILVALTYFTRERYSRLTLGLFMVYAFVLISATRLISRQVLSEVRKRGRNLRHILVVGAGELGQRVIDTIESHRELGFRVAGVLSRNASKVGSDVKGVPVLGLIEEVDAVLERISVDQVLIALPIEDQPLVKMLMEQLALRTVDVKVVPDLYQYITVCGGLEEFGGLPIISLQGGPLHGWNVVAKRTFDILFASLVLLVCAVPMALAALLVKVTSRGPVLFRQERMGIDGRTFQMLKFRTMAIDAEANGIQMTLPKDSRRTPVGPLLRRMSIDELPQLWNVLKGEMSLVGPRPERPVFIEEFKKQVPKYHLRHKVKSGMTGWAQINGLRGQTSIQKRIEYDLYYIENWSLLLDLKILMRTAFGGFLSKNAY